MVNEQIFNSVTDFHTAFMQGLDDMLKNEDLNAATFNLVFGNAIQHHKERDLIARLESAKIRLAQKIDQTKTDDDTQIFLKLKDMRLDWQNWTMIEERKINSWNVQLNKFRILKPKGFVIKPVTQIFEKFNENDFNFNKVKDPTIWSGKLLDRQVSLYYNKFPYKDLQALLVLDPELNKEQFLKKEDHFFIWNLCLNLTHLYNLSIGYNSLGAYASVNHLHFHLMIALEKLTVVENQWNHNGGDKKYPANVFVFYDPESAWKLIETMNAKNISYNLLYISGKIYVFPRKFKGTYADPSWSTGLGWYEFSGNFIVYDEVEVNALTDEQIRNALANASINIEYNDMANFVKIAQLSEVKDNQPFCAEVNGKKLALYKVGGSYFATTNTCTHAGGPLCEGDLAGKTVTCPWHGSKFDVTTGTVLGGPAIDQIKTYRTRVNGDAIEVEML